MYALSVLVELQGRIALYSTRSGTSGRLIFGHIKIVTCISDGLLTSGTLTSLAFTLRSRWRHGSPLSRQFTKRSLLSFVSCGMLVVPALLVRMLLHSGLLCFCCWCRIAAVYTCFVLSFLLNFWCMAHSALFCQACIMYYHGTMCLIAVVTMTCPAFPLQVIWSTCIRVLHINWCLTVQYTLHVHDTTC